MVTTARSHHAKRRSRRPRRSPRSPRAARANQKPGLLTFTSGAETATIDALFDDFAHNLARHLVHARGNSFLAGAPSKSVSQATSKPHVDSKGGDV